MSSTVEETSATYNVSAGYITVWQYFNNSLNEKIAVSWLNELFEENESKKESLQLP